MKQTPAQNRALRWLEAVANLAAFLRDDRAGDGQALSEYEVYATKQLYRDDVLQTEKTIHRVPAAEIAMWTQRLAGDNETTDLMIRAKIGATWTQWDRNSIFHRSINPDLATDSFWILDESSTPIYLLNPTQTPVS